MFEFIKIQYQMGKINKNQVKQYAAFGWITETEKLQIIGND